MRPLVLVGSCPKYPTSSGPVFIAELAGFERVNVIILYSFPSGKLGDAQPANKDIATIILKHRFVSV
jgi:hypothetical protein